MSDRYSRQAKMIPKEALARVTATIIGTGAIGRQVALQLAAIGCPRIQLIDPDTVEEVNLASQGFLETDVGKTKVQAVTDLCKAINSSCEISAICDIYKQEQPHGNVIFMCVDSITTRDTIFRAKRDHANLIIDGRMSAEVLRILVVNDKKSARYYETTIFPQEEAFGTSCTSRTTIYTSNIAAGMMIAQFTKWLRSMPLDKDIQFSILTNELSVDELT